MACGGIIRTTSRRKREEPTRRKNEKNKDAKRRSTACGRGKHNRSFLNLLIIEELTSRMIQQA